MIGFFIFSTCAVSAFSAWLFYKVGKTVGYNEGKTEAEKRIINILHGRIDE